MILGLSAGLLLLTTEAAPPAPGLKTAQVAGLAFLGLALLSSLSAVAPARSLGMNLTLLPPAVLFFLWVSRFEVSDLPRLLACLSVMAGLASAWFLWTAWTHPGASPQEWMTQAGIPCFSVPNDLLLLAIVSPLTVVLMSN